MTLRPSSPVSLHATAALVMHWGYPAFFGRTKGFADLLDLSPARDLIRRCEDACPLYGEVDRKPEGGDQRDEPFNNSFRTQTGYRTDPCCRMVTTCIRTPRCSRDPIDVIECDHEGMEEKKGLYAQIAPEWRERAFCITADIADPKTLSDIVAQKNALMLIILEGITYPMEKGWVLRMIQTFSGREAAFLIEYLLPDDLISPDRRTIPADTFRIVQDACSCPLPVRYFPDGLC